MRARFPSRGPVALVVALLVSAGLGWLLAIGRWPFPAAERVDLLEWLHADGRRDRPLRPVPPPPPAPLWQSPMASLCPAVDRELVQRLRRASLRARSIPTDRSNFGPRFQRDAYGNRIDPTPRVVVLHETVYGIQSAISTFLTHHPRDEDQVSYHTLVGLDGDVVQVLDPSLRAFGAGNSAFQGEWVITNPQVGGSINNFALHLSLETPLDGENNAAEHSGYSAAQYDATALQLAQWMRRFNIPWQNITTHRHVDLGGERADPRSFDWAALKARLIVLGLTQPC